ncbi:VIT family-domain-containing protein [Entophlyctis helioformis]|nr:VIT family-domain-containing protein [Entophlyctis helioformis]
MTVQHTNEDARSSTAAVSATRPSTLSVQRPSFEQVALDFHHVDIAHVSDGDITNNMTANDMDNDMDADETTTTSYASRTAMSFDTARSPHNTTASGSPSNPSNPSNPSSMADTAKFINAVPSMPSKALYSPAKFLSDIEARIPLKINTSYSKPSDLEDVHLASHGDDDDGAQRGGKGGGGDDDGQRGEDGQITTVDVVRDIIIGLSDGLTVPFALAAGLAALNNSKLVVLAGLAEIAAGSISMGLGGYLAGLSEQEYYDNQRAKEAEQLATNANLQREGVYSVFEPFGVSRRSVTPLVNELAASEQSWLDFIMKFDQGLDRPSKWRALMSALTIGFSYFCGGLVPLTPYMFIPAAHQAIHVSIAVTLTALFAFGYFKALAIESKRPLYSAVQMTVIGGLAAFVSFWVAKAVPGVDTLHDSITVAKPAASP